MSETTGTEGATPSSGATPDPAAGATNGEGATPTAGVDELVGDAGKRAIAQMRREARERDEVIAQQAAKLREMEDRDKSDVERLRGDVERLSGELSAAQEQLAGRDHDELRRRIADEHGIGKWWRRLSGTTEEELTADARTFAEDVNAAPPSAIPRDLGAGARSGGPATGAPDMSAMIRRKAGRG